MKLKSILVVTVGLMVSFSFQSCNKEEKELLKFYKSQERDPELVGWWKELSSDENYIRYTVYCENGEVHFYLRINGEEIWKNPTVEFWYTEDEILYIYNYQSHWSIGSFESSSYYSIKQDTLITTEQKPLPKAIRVDKQN